MEYRLKRIQAVQWFKVGDHPLVEAYRSDAHRSDAHKGEFWPVFAFVESVGRRNYCRFCDKPANVHGWFSSPGGDRTMRICPGEWIIDLGEHLDDSKRYKLANTEELYCRYEEVD